MTDMASRVDELIDRMVEARDLFGPNDVLRDFNEWAESLSAGERKDLARVARAKEEDIIRAMYEGWVNHGDAVRRLVKAVLALAAPAEQEVPRAALRASAPSGEIRLAALDLAHRLQAHGAADRRIASLAPPAPASLEFSDDISDDVYPVHLEFAKEMLATASIYVMDGADSVAALQSEPPETETFPPLPFPRVWIELRDAAGQPMPYAQFQYKELRDRHTLSVPGIGIVEVAQGRCWDIYFVAEIVRIGPVVLIQRIRPGMYAPSLPDDPRTDVAIEATNYHRLRSLAVGGAHLITARNVPTQRMPMLRAQRKRLAKSDSPGDATVADRVYYVDLRAAGEHDASGGTSGRVYQHRWLVRGHWRHHDRGTELCTCCGEVASYVQAYIKGPPGAPWKGRQVRRITHHQA